MCVCVTLHVKVENNFTNTIIYVRVCDTSRDIKITLQTLLFMCVCVTPHVKVENNSANTIIYVRVCDTSRECRRESNLRSRFVNKNIFHNTSKENIFGNDTFINTL